MKLIVLIHLFSSIFSFTPGTTFAKCPEVPTGFIFDTLCMRRRKLIRLILLVIVTGVVCLTIANLLHFRSEQVSENVGLVEEIQQPFWLLSIEPTQSFEYKKRTHCKHTQQHPSAAVDDLGVYCHRSSLLPHGCCPNPNSNSSPPSGTVNSRRNSTVSVRFACDTCDRNHCCSTYEFCVSCCLKPSNLPLWRELFGQALRFKQRHLLLSTNPFELCQAKCRTSSLITVFSTVIMIPDAHTTVANQLVQFVSATKRFPSWQTKSQFEDSAHLPLLHSTHPDSHLPTSPWHTIYEILAHEFARHLTAKKIPASSRTGSFLCAYAGHLFCLEHGLVDPGPDVASLTSSSVSHIVPLASPSLSSV